MKVQMGIDVDYIYCSKLPMKHRHQYFDDEPKHLSKKKKRKEQKSAWRQQREAKRQELENE